MSKSLATIATQPLIVAKVGLQSKPPPSRQGKPFKSFIEVMQFIVKNEGLLGLFKGIGPQISKGLIVQGLLMMTKERLACPQFNPGRKTDSQQDGAYVYPALPLLA
jgi:Mitochondrial carrier protein